MIVDIPISLNPLLIFLKQVSRLL